MVLDNRSLQDDTAPSITTSTWSMRENLPGMLIAPCEISSIVLHVAAKAIWIWSSKICHKSNQEYCCIDLSISWIRSDNCIKDKILTHHEGCVCMTSLLSKSHGVNVDTIWSAIRDHTMNGVTRWLHMVLKVTPYSVRNDTISWCRP